MQLGVVGELLAAAARRDHARVLGLLGELQIVPTERFRLQVCLCVEGEGKGQEGLAAVG